MNWNDEQAIGKYANKKRKRRMEEMIQCRWASASKRMSTRGWAGLGWAGRRFVSSETIANGDSP